MPELDEVVDEQLEVWCLELEGSISRRRRQSCAGSPLFSSFSFSELDGDSSYLSCFCRLIMAGFDWATECAVSVEGVAWLLVTVCGVWSCARLTILAPDRDG